MKQKKREPLSPEIKDSLLPTNIDDLLAFVKHYVDEDFAHIRIKDQDICLQCEQKPCLDFCPAHVFSLDGEGKTLASYEGCVECGSCRIGCLLFNVDWDLPRGGYGVAYKFG